MVTLPTPKVTPSTYDVPWNDSTTPPAERGTADKVNVVALSTLRTVVPGINCPPVFDTSMIVIPARIPAVLATVI